MSRPTPGPYEWARPAGNSRRTVITRADRGGMIATLILKPNDDETAANAALLAASWEMRDALRDVIERFVDEGGCDACDTAAEYGHADWCPLPAAERALAKAEQRVPWFRAM